MFFTSIVLQMQFVFILVSGLVCSSYAMDNHQEDYSDPALEFTNYWTLRGQQQRAVLNETNVEPACQESLDNELLKLDYFLECNDFKGIATLVEKLEHAESEHITQWLRSKALLGIVPCLHWYLKIMAQKLAGKESLDVLSEQERSDLRFCIVLGIFRVRQDIACFENIMGTPQALLARALRDQWKAWFEEFFKYEDDDLDLYQQTFQQVEEWLAQHEAQLSSPTWLCACSYSSIFRKILWVSVHQKSLNNLTHKSNQKKIEEVQSGVLLYNKPIFKTLTALHQIFSK